MLSFWDLPPPVRRKIYFHALNSQLDTVDSIDELHDHEQAHKIQRILRHGNDAAEIAIERCIRYPFTVHLPYAGLLRSSSRVRSEMRQAMQLLETRKVQYRLDALIEDEMYMLPTWVKCPVRTMEIYRLEIDCRLFGFAPQLSGDNEWDGLYQHGRDRCRTLAFALIALVARFIERGPRFEHLRQGEIKIHKLVLNFQSREKRQPHRSQLARSNSVDEENGLLNHLTLTALHEHEEHASEHDSAQGWGDRHDGGDASTFVPEEFVDASDLLRTVDLVLRPLCRNEQHMASRRQKHFSASHLAYLRRNVDKIYLVQDGSLKKNFAVHQHVHGRES